MLMRATHLLEAAASLPLRQCAIFLCNFKLICPVQSRLQKYSASRLTQITPTTPAIPSRKRGVGHRHERWDGMRWTRQHRARKRGCRVVLRNCERLTACRRTTLMRTVKPCGPGTRCWCQVGGGFASPTGFWQNRQSADDGDKTNSSPGRARSKPLKPLCRECRLRSVNLW